MQASIPHGVYPERVEGCGTQDERKISKLNFVEVLLLVFIPNKRIPEYEKMSINDKYLINS